MSSCFAFNFFRACHMIVVVVVFFFFSLEVVTSVAVAAKCLFLYDFFIYGFAFLPPFSLF